MRAHRLLPLAFCGALACAAQVPTAPPQQPVNPAQAAAASHAAQSAASTQQQQVPPPQGRPVVLDSVVAVINGSVLLESDVDQERRFEHLQLLPASEDTNVAAARRLITRTLVLQQMKEQGQTDTGITTADVNKLIAEMKRQLPGCAPHKCDTDAGWRQYLAGLGLTPENVFQHWRERLSILNYLNLRFRSGIRIPRSQIRQYYEQKFVPKFTAKHMQPPPLKSVSERIQEILLQEQVSKQIDDWEKTLRQQGSVRILVPAYGESNSNAENEEDFSEGGA